MACSDAFKGVRARPAALPALEEDSSAVVEGSELASGFSASPSPFSRASSSSLALEVRTRRKRARALYHAALSRPAVLVGSRLSSARPLLGRG